jgi:hypothetical protein
VPLQFMDAQVVCTAPDCPGHLTPDMVRQHQAC